MRTDESGLSAPRGRLFGSGDCPVVWDCPPLFLRSSPLGTALITACRAQFHSAWRTVKSSGIVILSGHAGLTERQGTEYENMKPKYVLPEMNLECFNCPTCHVFTKHAWGHTYLKTFDDEWGFPDALNTCICTRCGGAIVWLNGLILYPPHNAAPPNKDLPENVQKDYLEAASIVSASPRGAAALLRLAIQKLCQHLGLPGDNINADIQALVARGLSPTIQQALDVVRVIGNHAVHPGKIDIDDNPDIAQSLFKLVNIIAEKLMTEPKVIGALYASLPKASTDAIDKRDGKGK